MDQTILALSTDNHPPRGLVAFDSLQAEEEPWLARCYVPPTDFPLMAGWRSALVFGDTGSGKTALRLALERDWCPPGVKPPVLLVHWPVTIAPASERTGTALVLEHVSQIMDLVARALLQHLVRYPEDWGAAPSWAQNTLTWFIQHYWRGDLDHHVASLENQYPVEGLALLHQMAMASVPDILYPGTPTPLVIAELVRALEVVDLEGVRIVVDGLEPWVTADARRLAEHLEQFLSALALFEHARFAYAMLLPSALESPLWSAGGVIRRRADSYTLKSDTKRLCAIVERRLALALGRIDFALEQLGPVEMLIRWLKGCAGHSPRGWLKTIRPFLVTYLTETEAGGARKPLTEEQCVAVQRRHPPRIFVDLDTERVTVGWQAVTGLQAGQQALLRYLYQHRGQICGRRDVYRAYLEGTGRELPVKEFAKDYASALDNAIYRLRQAVEPDPAHPVLIVTVKREGLRLDNAW